MTNLTETMNPPSQQSNKEGTDTQCPAFKPICYREKNNINAFLKDVDAMKSKKVGDTNCPSIRNENTKKDIQYCAKFDYVWLTNINDALKKLKILIEESDKNPDYIKNILSTMASDTQQQEIPQFDIVTFIKDIVSLANTKWSGNNKITSKITELNNVSDFLKQELQGKETIQNNYFAQIVNELDAESIQMIKKNIEQVKALLEVARYIGLYNGDKLDVVDQERIIELLNTFGKITETPTQGGSTQTRGGKLKYKKGKRKTRRYRTKGGSFKGRLIQVATFPFAIPFGILGKLFFGITHDGPLENWWEGNTNYDEAVKKNKENAIAHKYNRDRDEITQKPNHEEELAEFDRNNPHPLYNRTYWLREKLVDNHATDEELRKFDEENKEKKEKERIKDIEENKKEKERMKSFKKASSPVNPITPQPPPRPPSVNKPTPLSQTSQPRQLEPSPVAQKPTLTTKENLYAAPKLPPKSFSNSSPLPDQGPPLPPRPPKPSSNSSQLPDQGPPRPPKSVGGYKKTRRQKSLLRRQRRSKYKKTPKKL